MGLMDDIKSVSMSAGCKVATWIAGLDKSYRAEVLEALASDFPSRTIWRVIVAREGMVFSESVFSRHRKGECGCGIQG